MELTKGFCILLELLSLSVLSFKYCTILGRTSILDVIPLILPMSIWNQTNLPFGKLTSHLKMDGWNTRFLLGPGLFFRGEVLVSGSVKLNLHSRNYSWRHPTVARANTTSNNLLLGCHNIWQCVKPIGEENHPTRILGILLRLSPTEKRS